MKRNAARLFLLCLAGALGAQEIRLVPLPRTVERGAGVLVLKSPVRIALASDSDEDRFAAALLVDELKSVHRLDAAIGSEGTILIGRPGNARIDSEIARRKLDISGLNHEESYVLNADSSGVLLAAKTAEGLFYGVQTLRQLAGPAARVPAVHITDWPVLRYRSLSVDISRGPVPTEEQIRAMIRTAAEYKLNMMAFYMEHVFRFTHAPLVAPTGGEISADQMKRVVAYARQHHVDIVPRIQTFGHLHNMLKFERYQEMAEIPHGSVLAENPQSYEWIRQSCVQLAATFPSKFMHIGADETWELGEGRSREYVERMGVGAVYFAHMNRVAEMLRPLGKSLMFSGDIALRHSELMPKLAKDMVPVVWVYSVMGDYSARIAPFRDQGLRYFVAPGVANWNRVFPNFGIAVPNINNFVRDGKKLGATGMWASEWKDDGEALFNMTWYGVVFAGAAAWQTGLVDVEAFDRAFDWAFYRNADQTFVTAIRSLNQAHELLRSAGVGDANNTLFWTDPFSRYGADTIRKAYPVASQIRLLAEQAAVDLAKAKPRGHGWTAPFLEFAARRMDYLGMKIQFSREIADSYRAVLADSSDPVKTRNRMRRISGMDGLVPSLRDYIHEIKAMYRDVWLRENRPYWLDNVLGRYDAEALAWVRRMRVFEAAAQEQAATGTLPDPEKLGLYLP